MVNEVIRSAHQRSQVREALQDYSRNRSQLSELLHAIKQERLFATWGFGTFRDYVEQECDLTERTVESMIDVQEILINGHGVSREAIEQLGWSKAYFVAASLRKRHCKSADVEQLLEDAARKTLVELRESYRQSVLGSAEDQKNLLAGDDLEFGDIAMDPEWLAQQEAERKTVLSLIASQILVAPRKRWPDSPPGFVVSNENWQQLCFAIDAGKNALIIGPSGSGKTELVRHCAHLFGRELEVFNFGAMTEPRTSLIGTTHYDPERGTHFGESRFVRALQVPGKVLLLDELNRCQPDVYNLLLPVLDGQRYLALDEQEGAPVVQLAAGVCFFATANVGNEYPGIEPIDKALKDRFPTVIPMWFPSQEQEAKLLLDRMSGLSEHDAQILARFASQQRQQWHEGEFSELVSTRALLAAAAQVVHGFAISTAIRFCVINHFSDEGGEQSDRTKLKQLLQRLI